MDTPEWRAIALRPDEESVLGVDEGQMAYLDDDLREETGYTGLETGSLIFCYGVALRDRDSGAVAMLHAVGERKLDQVRYGHRRAAAETGASFDEAAVVTDAAPDKAWDAVTGYLQDAVGDIYADREHGSEPLPNPHGATMGETLGVDADGVYQVPEPVMPDEAETDHDRCYVAARDGRLVDRTAQVRDGRHV